MNQAQSVAGRRRFLKTIAAAGAASFTAPAWAWNLQTTGKLKLGFDNFSIRAFNYKALQLIDYAASQNVDVLLLSDLDVYESLEDDHLEAIRNQAEQAGIELQVGTGSICPTSRSYNRERWGPAEDHARLLIHMAQRLGSPVARCYLGTRDDRDAPGGIYRHIEQTVDVLKAVRSRAEDANVKIAVENHAGDMQAWELVELIEAAGREFVGATMDPGNATWTIEDPMLNLELLGPYALTTGIRDSAVWESEGGAISMWTNMGRGSVDWPAYVKRFGELCPKTPFVLEIISYRWANESRYLEPQFWSRFPRARAKEFARYVALAKRGQPFELPPNRPREGTGADLEQAQQKFDLEASLRYCREELGLGLKS